MADARLFVHAGCKLGFPDRELAIRHRPGCPEPGSSIELLVVDGAVFENLCGTCGCLVHLNPDWGKRWGVVAPAYVLKSRPRHPGRLRVCEQCQVNGNAEGLVDLPMDEMRAELDNFEAELDA